MLSIVAAEVLDECRNLTLELDVKRLYDIEAAVAGLTGYNPIYIYWCPVKLLMSFWL